jgi:hypothetical protein
MDIVKKRRVVGGHGNEAAEYSDIISRACSWSRGADASAQDIDAEKTEEDKAFGGVHPNTVDYELDGSHTPKGGRTDGVKR